MGASRCSRAARADRNRSSPRCCMPFRPLLVSWSGRGDAAQLSAAEPRWRGADAAAAPACCPASISTSSSSTSRRVTIRSRSCSATTTQALRRLVHGRRARARVARVREASARVHRLRARVRRRRRRATTSSGPTQGLSQVREDAPGAYSGRCLLALQQRDAGRRETLDVARRVLRQALDHCLEGRELRTRTVARSMSRRG